jgi:hypothetical protein
MGLNQAALVDQILKFAICVFIHPNKVGILYISGHLPVHGRSFENLGINVKI